MIRNVIFDMGKVLLDYDPLLPCYRHARDWEVAQKLNAAIFGRPEWGKYIDGGLLTDPEFIKIAEDKLENAEQRALAMEVLDDWWYDALYLKSGMDKLIKDLLDAGVSLYILSNVGYTFHKFSYKIPCYDQFSGVVLSCEEKLCKPEPALFQRVCDRYSLVPEETLFVDDSAPNIEGAESIGLQGHCFFDGDVNRLRERLAEVLK